jgi:hypothetical protein
MAKFKTDTLTMVCQICKDCPFLIVERDGEHVDPPEGECRLDTDHACFNSSVFTDNLP